MKKLLHVSDLHLGAKLCDRDRVQEQKLLLDWLCTLMERERPDVLVVAGDVFDIYYPPVSVQTLWFDFLARVRRENLAGRVVAIAGNHDSPSAIGCAGKVLDLVGVSLLAGDTDATTEAIRIDCADGGALAVVAIPFQREGAMRNQGGGDAAAGFATHAASAIDAAVKLVPGAPVVVVAHATVSGSSFSDSVSERARRAVGGIEAVPASAFSGVDYTALGHLHLPQKVGGSDFARYCGSLLPMSFAEGSSPKSAVIVEFPGGRGEMPVVREIEVPIFRPLRTLSGSPDEAVKSAKALAAESPCGLAGPAWAHLSISRGDGDFRAACRAVREALSGSGVELVGVSDDRAIDLSASPTAAAPLSSEDLRAIGPLRLASDRLSEPDLHLSEEQRATLEKMLAEVLQ